jgi:septum formation protein
VSADLDEDGLTTSDPEETARLLALSKARHVASLRVESLVIGGDTVVALGSRQFGKPKDSEEAAAMLSELSGQTHRVITGLALVWPGGEVADFEVTSVKFRELDEAEIRAYASSGEPLDKAGGYAIQGGAAGFVDGLAGEQDCVVGFPAKTFGRLLLSVG